MAIRAKIETNIREVRPRFRRFANLMDERKLLMGIGQRHLKFINDNFRQEGIEKKWPPLSPNTIAARRGGSSKPLQDTGRLRQSFTVKVRPGQVEVGTQQEVAEYHEFGTRPYEIRPRTANKLRFVTARGVVFADEVQHPGLPERKMLPSLRMGTKLAIDFLEAVFQKGAARL